MRYSPSPRAPSARARNPKVSTPHRALPNLLAAALPRLRKNAAILSLRPIPSRILRGIAVENHCAASAGADRHARRRYRLDWDSGADRPEDRLARTALCKAGAAARAGRIGKVQTDHDGSKPLERKRPQRCSKCCSRMVRTQMVRNSATPTRLNASSTRRPSTAPLPASKVGSSQDTLRQSVGSPSWRRQ